GENEADDNRGRGARDAPRGVGEQDDGQCPEDRLNLEDARDGGSKRAAEEGEQVRVEGAHEEGVPSHGSLAEDELRPVPVDLAVGPQAPAQRRGREPTQVRDAPGPGEQEQGRQSPTPRKAGSAGSRSFRTYLSERGARASRFA